VTKSRIKIQFETDEQNRKAVYESVGAAAALPDDLDELYALQYAAIDLQTYSAQVAGALYVACRKHLVLATTSLFRRYSSQAFRETRAAVETAGIAHAIRQDTECLQIFVDDQGSGASRAAARNRLKPGMIFVGRSCD